MSETRRKFDPEFREGAADSVGTEEAVVFHSDRGGEYTGQLFANACADAGITQSMGRTGAALDNAAAESFNSTLEFELLRDHHFTTTAEARAAAAAYIEEYDTTRLHSSLGVVSPIDYDTSRVQQEHPNGGGRREPAKRTLHGSRGLPQGLGQDLTTSRQTP